MDFTFTLNSMSPPGEPTAVTELSGDTVYDCVIIGGGPAALTAAVYIMRKGINAALVTENFGGQVIDTAGIENYMGYRYIEGGELAAKFRDHLKQFTLAIGEGVRVEKINPDHIHRLTLSNGLTLRAKTIIVASGKAYRKLGIPGEKELTGHGVAYCTICDAPLFKGKDVIVAGGGNSGVESAIDLAPVASHVTIIQNLERLTGDRVLISKLNEFSNVSIIYNHVVAKINGDRSVSTVTVHSLADHTEKDITVAGVFVAVGLIPNSTFAEGVLQLNKFGEIEVDSHCATSVEGIFAAGDVTSVPYKQIIIAAGEGAKAALSAYDYLLSQES